MDFLTFWTYFLDIQADDLEGKVEYYVGLLLSGAENSLVA